MAVEDTWFKKDGSPTKKHGQGKRYRARYRGQSKSFDRLKPAQRHELKLRTEPPKPVVEITVGELLDSWLLGKQGLSKSRIQGCSAAADRARAEWGDRLAASVGEQEVRQWQGRMQTGASSKRKAMEALSGAMRIGIQLGAIEANPCVDVRRPAEPRRDPRFLTPAELELLADLAGEYRPMVLLMGTSGLRVGEACHLRVGDVDARRRRIWIASATTKTRRGREVPVRRFVLELLPLGGRARSDWLFTSARGGRVDEHNWRARHFTPAVTAAGLGDDLTPHVLRHTAASLAVRSGADVKAVQRMLGHGSAKITLDTYSGLWDEGLDTVMDRMDTLFGAESRGESVAFDVTG